MDWDYARTTVDLDCVIASTGKYSGTMRVNNACIGMPSVVIIVVANGSFYDNGVIAIACCYCSSNRIKV